MPTTEISEISGIRLKYPERLGEAKLDGSTKVQGGSTVEAGAPAKRQAGAVPQRQALVQTVFYPVTTPTKQENRTTHSGALSEISSGQGNRTLPRTGDVSGMMKETDCRSEHDACHFHCP